MMIVKSTSLIALCAVLFADSIPPEHWTVAIAAVLTAATPGFLAWLQTRKTHLAINSRMDELLRITKEQANAAGQVQGVAAEKAAQALKAKGALEAREQDKDK